MRRNECTTCPCAGAVPGSASRKSTALQPTLSRYENAASRSALYRVGCELAAPGLNRLRHAVLSCCR